MNKIFIEKETYYVRPENVNLVDKKSNYKVSVGEMEVSRQRI